MISCSFVVNDLSTVDGGLTLSSLDEVRVLSLGGEEMLLSLSADLVIQFVSESVSIFKQSFESICVVSILDKVA